MNKLTKVGCSALCGSLAAISAANAGELTATGGADLTFVSAGSDTTGNPIGMGSNINFKGSGELDNGWTFDFTVAQGNAKVFSAANVNITMGGLGKFNINQGNSGNGIAAFDDMMPTAWEEAWGAGLSGGTQVVLGSGASTNIMYTTPTVAGTTITLTKAFQYGAADTADKTVAANSDGLDDSYDATININPSLGTEILSGLNIYGGLHTTEIDQSKTIEDSKYEGVVGVTYDLGPLSLGVMGSGLYTGEESSTSVYHTYKNSAYGVAFNVNDDLSVSYGQYTTRQVGYHEASVQDEGRSIELSSWQVAYSMGGASLAIADTHATNVLHVLGRSRSTTTVSLGLAF